jgi:hypothetical protein
MTEALHTLIQLSADASAFGERFDMVAVGLAPSDQPRSHERGHENGR